MNLLKSFAIILLAFLSITDAAKAQKVTQEITIKLVGFEYPSSHEINYGLLETDAPYESGIPLKPGMRQNALVYSLYSNKPITLSVEKKYFLAEPGDQLIFTKKGQDISVEGKGSEKNNLLIRLRALRETVKKPSNPSDIITRSEADFLEWYDYLSASTEKGLSLIDGNKGRISAFAYDYIRYTMLGQDLDDISDKFGGIRAYKSIGITQERAMQIYDTKYKPYTDKYFSYTAAYTAKTWKPVMYAVMRKYGFNSTAGDKELQKTRWVEYLREGRKAFKGSAKERFTTELLYDISKEFDFFPEIEAEIKSYLAEPDYIGWKTMLRQKLDNLRDLLNAHTAKDFALTDAKGNMLTKASFKNKLAIFDYWFTGCAGCVQMAPAMRKLEEKFNKDTNVVFVNVSIDESREQWLKSITAGKYTSGKGVNVYTGGKGKNHTMIRDYAIHGYPSLVLLDPHGRTINLFPKLDPRSEAGYQRMSDFIEQQLLEMKDGPYLLHAKDSVDTYTFDDNQMSKKTQQKASLKSLKVNTHQLDKQFEVKLKNNLENEPSIYPEAKKLLVFSDIEGDFKAFTKLLQANKVIDQNYNWTFGYGHLVFAGDMFDRGNQVTECLWLMYALEDKAKAAGGYVHFVLGNHEIMNLQGITKYAQPKYITHSEKAGKTLAQFYGEDSELGRWLRTKNIVEKIGDLLFAHGGIGLEFANAVSLPVNGINDVARPHYANSEARKSGDKNVQMIFDSTRGPFWYRFYYEDAEKKGYHNVKDTTIRFTVYKPTQLQIDSLLKVYGAKHIITGHSIVADTISTHYNNRVINTDVPHAKGKSEALLIEGTSFYRVNDKGERKLLFRDPEQKDKAKK